MIITIRNPTRAVAHPHATLRVQQLLMGETPKTALLHLLQRREPPQRSGSPPEGRVGEGFKCTDNIDEICCRNYAIITIGNPTRAVAHSPLRRGGLGRGYKYAIVTRPWLVREATSLIDYYVQIYSRSTAPYKGNIGVA